MAGVDGAAHQVVGQGLEITDFINPPPGGFHGVGHGVLSIRWIAQHDQGNAVHGMPGVGNCFQEAALLRIGEHVLLLLLEIRIHHIRVAWGGF